MSKSITKDELGELLVIEFGFDPEDLIFQTLRDMLVRYVEAQVTRRELEANQDMLDMTKRVKRKAQEQLLDELAEKGHGGGNWRRLIEMKRQELKEEE